MGYNLDSQTQPIKWDNISQSSKIYKRNVYRILRSKKPGEAERGTISHVLTGGLEDTKEEDRDSHSGQGLGTATQA